MRRYECVLDAFDGTSKMVPLMAEDIGEVMEVLSRWLEDHNVYAVTSVSIYEV